MNQSRKTKPKTAQTTPAKRARNGGDKMALKEVTPLTNNQAVFFDVYEDYKAISLTGSAGTGKTYMALFKALEEFEIDDEIYSVKIVRSAVSGRDQGFLPGDQEEKLSAYEGPYINIVNDLYGRDDAYSLMKTKRFITFESTSFLRGLTFNNCIIVLDEAQNLDDQEIFTILTRIGENCRIIICGDTKQDDLTSERYKEHSGYGKALKVLESMSVAKAIQFGPSDIVRSDFVKDFIIAYENYGKKEFELTQTLKLIKEPA